MANTNDMEKVKLEKERLRLLINAGRSIEREYQCTACGNGRGGAIDTEDECAEPTVHPNWQALVAEVDNALRRADIDSWCREALDQQSPRDLGLVLQQRKEGEGQGAASGVSQSVSHSQ